MKKFLFALMGLIIAGNAFGDECGCIATWDDTTDHIVVTFEIDQFTVCGCAKDEIKKFLGNLQDIKQVELIGSTDATGTDGHNKKLSGNRINAVKDVLPAGISVQTWNEGESDSDYNDIQGSEKIYRSVTIIPVQKHVSEICGQTKIQEIIQNFPAETIELKDACNNKNLSNDKVIEILEKLAKRNPAIKEIVKDSGVYKLYAELLTETEDIRRRVSVWRTAEGKFNTARLISDSVAGVVLGTVGGVVTSNLIKKSQVKQGFEDLRCAIGGQNVAHWGDEFRVGLVH